MLKIIKDLITKLKDWKIVPESAKKIRLVISITITLISLLMELSTLTMDSNEGNLMKRTYDELVQENIDLEEALRRLEEINTTRDPIQLQRLREIIVVISEEHGIDLNHLLYPQLQHPVQGTGCNSGEVIQDRSSLFATVIIGIVIFTAGYLIMRNWDSIQEVLFDVVNDVLIPQRPDTIIIQGTRMLLTNPVTRRSAIRMMLEIAGPGGN